MGQHNGCGLEHPLGPVGVCPPPSANGKSVWGRNTESVEGHGGEKHFATLPGWPRISS